MATYTTGELAKICGISIRTIQYYDQKNLLSPDHFNESGKRIYSNKELQTLRIILGYKQLGFTLKDIRKVMANQQNYAVLELLLDRQITRLDQQIKVLEAQKQSAQYISDTLHNSEPLLENTLGDIDGTMQKNKELKQLHQLLILFGILADLLEIGLLFLGIVNGIWWPMFIGIPIIVFIAGYMTKEYNQNTAYICPNCKTVFKIRLKKLFFSAHTPKTRKLICPHCGKKAYCIETFAKE
ncbi:hypothetical protein BSQ39_01810 [Loigolactobacillus backii]|uniref:MerR family transcriptional regulator n=1 Tax=Loigolactobacillus TaxID=2767889 RepID=UPI000C1CB77B|nr:MULTISPECIES: MerR family transcriptional regulator [Loigolactobacillus]PIO82385.1 hypothetical protein BSQ39_01810 [Loigolactobacillus backii]